MARVSANHGSRVLIGAGLLLLGMALPCTIWAQEANPAPGRRYDVLVVTSGAELAAYQLEIRVRTRFALISAVEGGDGPTFEGVPYHDEQALPGQRIILASFSTAKELPRGRTVVARVRIDGEHSVSDAGVALSAATNRYGMPIPARALLEPRPDEDPPAQQEPGVPVAGGNQELSQRNN